MPEEKEKTIETDQKTITAGAIKDELSEEDFEKIVGGDRESSAPSVSEIVVTKPT
jgi:hypothetical protein